MNNIWPQLTCGAALVLSSASALAQELPACDDLGLPNPIYGAGGSAITPSLRQVAPFLASLPEPVSVLFSDPSACNGYAEFLANAVTTPFRYWGADGVEQQCAPRAGGQPVDFAHMGNPADFCPNQVLPPGVVDLQAPIQTLNFIVDSDSPEQAISAEALYFIFGFGAAGGVAPWTNTEHLVRRGNASFVHLFAAAAAGLPPTGFVPGATEVASNGESVTRLVAFGEASPTTPLAYVAGSTADGARATVRTLAFQNAGESCAHWPDSSADAFDKVNVRSGDYALWTPGHFFYRVDAETGVAQNPVAAEALGWITGDVPTPFAADITARVIRAGDIPHCAMRARRSGVIGPIEPFTPSVACGCFFEQTATGAAPSACRACASDADCSVGTSCSFGFCEATASTPDAGVPLPPTAADAGAPPAAECSASFDNLARIPGFDGTTLPPLPPPPAPAAAAAQALPAAARR
ncbi:MAG TPA: hypothetical protein VNN80_04860 [Polyangiaceae bacterium]|nr:hypothetical protein [Polyangiaceae bacterium]